ncbi:MAG: carbamoyltransferase [Saprospiraceae bacterium]
MKKILGISAFYHDSAAALVVDGQIIAAAQEERFTREKHTADFPVHAIRYCLEEGGFSIDELDAIVFYDKPLLTFERLLETYYAFAPSGLISFLKAIPVWLNEKLFLKKQIYDGLKEVGSYQKKNVNLLFTEHHLSHAASAFFASPYEQAAILTIDGVGEWSTATIGIGEQNKITFLKELHFPHSVGLFYSAFTYYLGFRVNSGEYKLMGLAPYGDPQAEETSRFVELIKQHLVHIHADGSIWLDQKYFNYATGLTMVKAKKWEQIFGIAKRKAESDLTQTHCNLALACQQVTEEIVLRMAVEAQKLTNCDRLCLAGGVALNCVANGKLLKKNIFKDIYIQPAAGDAGGALGAAFATHFIYFEQERKVAAGKDIMQNAHLGPYYSRKEIVSMTKKTKAVYEEVASYAEVCDFIAEKIAAGKIVGWFQDRMEFGPRALGNRSILADPRNEEMQKKLNLKIKYRESFRPFAPVVLAEDAGSYFDLAEASPYMLLVAPVREKKRRQVPEDYHQLPLWEKLYVQRSSIPAVTHLDFSARIQTVDQTDNPKFWQLLQSFKNLTDCSLLINTSFNVRGEPIVNTPMDAYRCFRSTDMDYLVIQNFIFAKTDQPNWEQKETWQIAYKKD